jgi:hypothetical protein
VFLSPTSRINLSSPQRKADFFGFRHSAQWGEDIYYKLTLSARHHNKKMFGRKIGIQQNEIKKKTVNQNEIKHKTQERPQWTAHTKSKTKNVKRTWPRTWTSTT